MTKKINYPDIRNTLYTKNDNYWNEPTVENSYWAGFIAADGNLGMVRKTLIIHITLSDISILEKFKQAIQYTGPIKLIKGTSYTYKFGNVSGKPAGYTIINKDSVRLVIGSAHQYHLDLLKHYNITPKKSLTLQPPNITDPEMIKAFIVGYIDGDGSIGFSNVRGYNKFYFNIVGTESMLTWIKQHVNFGNATVRRKTNNSSSLTAAANVGRRAYMSLMNVDVPRLDRKWQWDFT